MYLVIYEQTYLLIRMCLNIITFIQSANVSSKITHHRSVDVPIFRIICHEFNQFRQISQVPFLWLVHCQIVNRYASLYRVEFLALNIYPYSGGNSRMHGFIFTYLINMPLSTRLITCSQRLSLICKKWSQLDVIFTLLIFMYLLPSELTYSY